MLKEFSYNNNRVCYSNLGAGSPIVLLHGLCEDITIWETFTKRFTHRFRTLCLHLPGNGVTQYPSNLSVDYMADVVKATLDKENINKTVVIGHSMGGYVALALAEKYPERLKGIGLFHSYALADDEEKKAARNKNIDFIQRNGRTEYIKQMFPALFDESFKVSNQRLINQLIYKAVKGTTDESIIATLTALRDRPDRTHVLKETDLPILFVAGKKDTSIPYQKLAPQMLLPKNSTQCILDNINHMGMLENYIETSQAVMDFTISCYNVPDLVS